MCKNLGVIKKESLPRKQTISTKRQTNTFHQNKHLHVDSNDAVCLQTGDLTSDEHGCLPFFRSIAACFLHPEADVGQALQRQQMNGISSFMDASVVYGHTPKLERSLRDLAGLNGKLVINSRFRDPKGRPYLPSVAGPSACLQDPQGERVECFRAGDSRANEGLLLAALHTLLLREHNRIAEVLKHINDHWSPETVYQETRKIIGALIQVRDHDTAKQKNKLLSCNFKISNTQLAFLPRMQLVNFITSRPADYFEFVLRNVYLQKTRTSFSCFRISAARERWNRL